MAQRTVSNTFILAPATLVPTAVVQVLAEKKGEEPRGVDDTILMPSPRAGGASSSSLVLPTVGVPPGRPDTAPTLQGPHSGPRAGVREPTTIVITELIARAREAGPRSGGAGLPGSDVWAGGRTTVPRPAPGSGYRGYAPTERRSLPRGFEVHNYRIEEPIGEGGFAIMYRATDVRLPRQVALKELFVPALCHRQDDLWVGTLNASDDEKAFQWAKWFFSEEARITSSLRHQNVVTMLEFFKTNGTAYIAYELLKGADLNGWAKERRHRLSHAEAMELFRLAAEALRYVHKTGYVHGDVKPSNIFLDSEAERPILIDFGSAAKIGEPRRGGYTTVTHGFSPLEQYGEAMRPDPRVDIYALAATMYWALTGKTPPSAPDRRNHDSLKPLGDEIDPEFRIGSRLCRVVDRGLALDQAERFATVDEMLDDLYPKVYLSSTGYAAVPRGDKVFLSYRRDDSEHFAGRLLDFLEMRLGQGSVFFDVESIPGGIDFWDHIKSNLQQCAVMLVVMGPDWQETLEARRRRWYHFAKSRDFVAEEISAAIQLELPIVPVFFDGAKMPSASTLPRPLRILPSLNGTIVGGGKAFRAGADGLCDQITKIRTDFYSKSL